MRRPGGTESRTNWQHFMLVAVQGENLPVQQRRMDLGVAGRTSLKLTSNPRRSCHRYQGKGYRLKNLFRKVKAVPHE